jgi:hypothetical protein
VKMKYWEKTLTANCMLKTPAGEHPTYRELDPGELIRVSGGGASSPSVSEIVVTKRMDQASTKLFL